MLERGADELLITNTYRHNPLYIPFGGEYIKTFLSKVKKVDVAKHESPSPIMPFSVCGFIISGRAYLSFPEFIRELIIVKHRMSLINKRFVARIIDRNESHPPTDLRLIGNSPWMLEIKLNNEVKSELLRESILNGYPANIL